MNSNRAISDVALAVDLDGTLIKSDLLVEGFFHLASSSPIKGLMALKSLTLGKAPLKEYIADHISFQPALLPYNEGVLEYIKEARTSGRKIYLVSASDERYVQSIADHLGLFDGVMGSNNGVNLSSKNKADKLVEVFGVNGFDYIGNSDADLAVWDKARKPLLAGARSAKFKKYLERFPNISEVGVWNSDWRVYTKAMRLHQWLKNTLIFVPIMLAQLFSLDAFGLALLAFFAFSLCASGVYILNDMFDLQNDRSHSRKKERPLASGRMPLLHGVIFVPVLLIVSISIGTLVSPQFLMILAVYFAITLSYSAALKRVALLDVTVLAILYTVRIFAGGIAVGVTISEWLMAFSIFLFLFLAIIKRYVELGDSVRNDKGPSTGRGFTTDDLSLLRSLGSTAGYIAVLVLALYIQDPEIRILYQSPEILWGACLLLLLWVNRMILAAHRGQMHDDPVVFAATDRVSLGIAAGVAGFFLLSVCGVLA